MQTTVGIAAPATSFQPTATASKDIPAAQALAHYQIIRRNGAVVPFEPAKIAVAMMKAFLAVHGTQGAASASVRETVDALTQNVVRAMLRSRPGGGTFHIEDVQDQVELGLMRGSHHEVARAYVLYRERRSQERAAHKEAAVPQEPVLHVQMDGQRVPLDTQRLKQLVQAACEGLGHDVSAEPILAETLRNLYDGIPMEEVHKASVLAARTLIEKEPGYTFVTARLLMLAITKEVLGTEATAQEMGEHYQRTFAEFLRKGVENDLLDPRLLQFDLARSMDSAAVDVQTAIAEVMPLLPAGMPNPPNSPPTSLFLGAGLYRNSYAGYNPQREPPRRARRIRSRARARHQAGIQRGLFALPLLRAHPGRDLPVQQARYAIPATGVVPALPRQDGGRLGLGQEPPHPHDPAGRGQHHLRRHR